MLLLGPLLLLLGPQLLLLGPQLFLIRPELLLRGDAALLLGQLCLLLGDALLGGGLLLEGLAAGVVHRQKDAQPREGRQSGRRDGHGVPDSAAALPAPEIVVGDGQHGGQQAQLLVFQLAPPVRAPNVRRQGLHLGALAGGVRFEADELGEAFVRLPLHQDGQHVAAALPFDEVFQLPHAPAAFQIPGGADGDKPLAAVQGSFDIRPQIGGQGQLLLIPEHPAHALFAGLGPYAGGHAVGFDGAVQGLGHLHVRALVPIADEGAVPLVFHVFFLSFGQKRGGGSGHCMFIVYYTRAGIEIKVLGHFTQGEIFFAKRVDRRLCFG